MLAFASQIVIYDDDGNVLGTLNHSGKLATLSYEDLSEDEYVFIISVKKSDIDNLEIKQKETLC